MQTVSQTYMNIINGDHYFETQVRIQTDGGYIYCGSNVLVSVKIQHDIFADGKPAIGKAIAAQLDLEMLKPVDSNGNDISIPRMAEIVPYIRAVNSNNPNNYSEWLTKGYFYIDTRTYTKLDNGIDTLSITAFDRMMKAEQASPSLIPPQTDISVVNNIASLLGTTVQTRTTSLINKNYQIELLEGWSCRETLSLIAGLYGGNFIVDAEGKLLLITFGGLPRETNYLIVGGAGAAEYITIPLAGEECKILLQEGTVE